MTSTILFLALGLGGGFLVSYLLRNFLDNQKVQKARSSAQTIIEKAETEKKNILLNARDESLKILSEAKQEELKRREYITGLEQKLTKKEETLDQKSSTLDQKQQEIEQIKNQISQEKEKVSELHKKQEEELVKVAKLTRDEAKNLLVSQVEQDFSDVLAKKVRQMEEEAREQAEVRARGIVANVIDRYAADFTAEFTVLSVALPNDEMKGRIIGKEGRNIQAFEKATGVDLLVDDTPGMVTISSFDTVRRHIAKLALEKMIFDGRIHPARIEEIVEKAKNEINEKIKQAGEKAVYDLGLNDIHPELIKLLGRLKFRTSYGQNQLDHAVEVAKIAEMLAAEIGADRVMAKKAALFHDIGKALSQEMGASHVDLGRDIAVKYGFSPEIINAMESNHEGAEAQTVEAVLVRAADAISASRPGVRRESVENYVKRLKELEAIANTFDGVDKSFAIQAGREVRVIVKPEKIDDYAAMKLANSIAAKIQKDLIYPGNIKVNVIRETRAVDYA
ncbi:MAG: ribonuclease Y [Patescibacteria group bacterium]